jgi:RNA polymerase sigma factor (sigma-70 family)
MANLRGARRRNDSHSYSQKITKPMKITAITRYKHGELYSVLNRLGWTQAELARRSGINQGIVGEIINLNKRPNQKNADAIQKAFGEAGEYFDVLEQWPEAFEGLKKGTTKEETMDVPMECLIGCREAMMIPVPDRSFEIGLESAMDECLNTLTEREKRVIEARFYESRTLQDVSKELGLTSRDRIRQIESKALGKLRHPSRAKILERFAESFLE